MSKIAHIINTLMCCIFTFPALSDLGEHLPASEKIEHETQKQVLNQHFTQMVMAAKAYNRLRADRPALLASLSHPQERAIIAQLVGPNAHLPAAKVFDQHIQFSSANGKHADLIPGWERPGFRIFIDGVQVNLEKFSSLEDLLKHPLGVSTSQLPILWRKMLPNLVHAAEEKISDYETLMTAVIVYSTQSKSSTPGKDFFLQSYDLLNDCEAKRKTPKKFSEIEELLKNLVHKKSEFTKSNLAALKIKQVNYGSCTKIGELALQEEVPTEGEDPLSKIANLAPIPENVEPQKKCSGGLWGLFSKDSDCKHETKEAMKNREQVIGDAVKGATAIPSPTPTVPPADLIPRTPNGLCQIVADLAYCIDNLEQNLVAHRQSQLSAKTQGMIADNLPGEVGGAKNTSGTSTAQ